MGARFQNTTRPCREDVRTIYAINLQPNLLHGIASKN